MPTEEPTRPTALSPAEIARRVKEARLALGLTRQELGKRAGVSAGDVVVQIERGIVREWQPRTLVQLALALGQPWDYLGATLPPGIRAGTPASYLYLARLKRGWSLAELARASGIDRTTIASLERGRGGQVLTWQAIAEALGMTLSDFFPAPLQNPDSVL